MRKLLLAICGLAVLSACGGGSGGGGGTSPPTGTLVVYVSMSPSGQTNIDQGQTVNFSATVMNDTSNKGVTWSVSGAGVTGSACGTFSNTTTTSATYNAPASVSSTLDITVTATSIADSTKSSSAAVIVFAPPSITTTALTNATPNAAYSATLQATGGVGTLTWTLAGGALPSGFSLSSSGVITGNPTVSGTSTFAVQVTDSSAGLGGPASAQAQLTLTVVTAMSISTTSLPAGTLGGAYHAAMDASGGTPPYTWSVTAGSLPPGLTLQPSSGEISGTPTSQGSTTFTVTAQDSSSTKQTRTQSLTMVIVAAAPLAITTSVLINATPNTNYSATLLATGGVGMLTWTMASGALPTGLSVSGSGVITGDPTVPGTSTFTVQVTDSSTAAGGPDSVQAQLSLTVVTVLSIITSSLAAGSEGITYLDQIGASGGTPPYTWTLTMGSLPPGLTLQPSSGAISGNPTAPGDFTFTVTARDSSPTRQSQAQSLTIAIGSPGPLVITTLSLLDGTLNTPYNARVAAMGGTPPYSWSVAAGALPASMSLNSSTGAISGTPPSTGTAYFTIAVTDSSSTPLTQAQGLSIVVNDAAAACTCSGNDALLSGSYVFSLSGFNDAGFLTVVGSFTADGAGNITGGEADTNGVLGVQHGNIIASASSYRVGSDYRGCATLATPFGTFVTRLALGSISSSTATRGQMIAWSSPSASAYIATGQLLRQTPSALAAGLSGSYLFRTIGWDTAPLGGRDVCVGVLSASGNTFNAMEQDCNDGWNVANTAAPLTAGTYTNLDANGRGTGIVALSTTNANITFYAVSGSQLLMLNADPTPAASGELEQQNMPAGGAGFTPASLSGKMVFYLDGLSMAGTASVVSMEMASADGAGSLAINFYIDRAGTQQVSSTLTCNYAVEPNGRVTLSSSAQSCGGTPPIFYLSDLNTGFIVDASPAVDTGSLEPQSAGPFNNTTLLGNFFGGMAEVVLQSVQAEVDPVAADGSGNITGTTVTSSTSAQDSGCSFLAATYAVNSDGTFSVNTSGGTVAGIIISSTKFVMYSPSAAATSYPTLLVMQK